jgi:predicted nucleotidyltransferase component of viral defense system
MNLHTDKAAYEELLTLAAERSGIERYKVEKDYWVCKMLREIALSEHGGKVYFKGGTSLSKGYGLIDRFSYQK